MYNVMISHAHALWNDNIIRLVNIFITSQNYFIISKQVKNS